MTEGPRHSEETPPQRRSVSEPGGTDRTVATDGASPEPAPQQAEARRGEVTPTPPSPRRQSLFRRPLLLVIATIAGIVIIALGIRYYQYVVSHAWTDDAFIDGHIIQISPKVAGPVLQVHVTDNQEVSQGDVLLEIDPSDYAVRLAQAQAVLQAALAMQQAAHSGVALMQATSEANIQQATAGVQLARSVVQTARAQVATARSRLDQARAQVDTALANAAQARAQVEAVAAEVTRANADAKRTQELYSSDQIVSRRDLDQAIKDARSAEAQLEAARKKVVAAEAQVVEARAAQQTAVENLRYIESQVLEAQSRVGEALGRLAAANAAPHQMAVSHAQADTTEAEVAQARAAVERAELDLQSTKIYAPETGRVTRKIVEAGAYVQVGQVVLAIVSHEVWVVANFMETQLADIRPGQAVEITVDAYRQQIFMGHVDSMQSGTGSRFSLLPPENASGNFVKVVQRVPVKIVFDTPPTATYLLSPGMSVIPVVQLR